MIVLRMSSMSPKYDVCDIVAAPQMPLLSTWINLNPNMIK